MRPKQLVSVYLNEQAQADSLGPVTAMEETLHDITSVPVVGNGTFNFARVFAVTINGANKVHYTTNLRASFTAAANGDILAVFPAPLGLPYIMGISEGTVFEGTAYSATAGDAKCADLTMTATGSVALQAFNIAIHDAVAGQTYTAVFKQTFLN